MVLQFAEQIKTAGLMWVRRSPRPRGGSSSPRSPETEIDPARNGYAKLMRRDGEDNADDGAIWGRVCDLDLECRADTVPKSSDWHWCGLHVGLPRDRSHAKRASFETTTEFHEADLAFTGTLSSRSSAMESRSGLHQAELALGTMGKRKSINAEQDTPEGLLGGVYPKLDRVSPHGLEKPKRRNTQTFTKEAFASYILGQGVQKEEGAEDTRSFMRSLWRRAPFVNYVFDHRWATTGWSPEAMVFSPDSKIMMLWDVIIILCVLATLIIAPFEVAILVHPLFFGLDVVMDVVFICDIFINMIVAFEEKGTITVHMNFDKKEIMRRYIHGWFAIDCICAVPLDLISPNLHPDHRTLQNPLRALRIIRLLRIFKISRLQILSRIDLPFTAITVLKCMLLTVISAHWVSCLWAALVLLQSGSHTTWLDALVQQKLDVSEEVRNWPFSLYLWSLYYSCTLITTVGFGDVVPQTHMECLVCTFDIIIGSVLWAYILSSLLNVLNRLNPHRADFESTMDELNAMMADHDLPDTLRHDVRHYFFECEDLWKFQRRGELIDRMSPSLKGRVTLSLCGEWIEKVEYVQQLFTHGVPESTQFVVEVSRHLFPKIFSPGERLYSPALYIIRKGLVSMGPRILGIGDVCGDDLLLHNQKNRSPFHTIALTTAGTLALSQFNLLGVLDRFPAQKRMIRRYTIWLACKRGLARELRAMVNLPDNHRTSTMWLRTIGKSEEHPDANIDDEDLSLPTLTVADLMNAVSGLEASMERQHADICRMLHETVMGGQGPVPGSARSSLVSETPSGTPSGLPCAAELGYAAPRRPAVMQQLAQPRALPSRPHTAR